jgi:hypothetical protein
VRLRGHALSSRRHAPLQRIRSFVPVTTMGIRYGMLAGKKVLRTSHSGHALGSRLHAPLQGKVLRTGHHNGD